MSQGKQPHILNASSNLLGICFVLITGLKISKAGQNSIVDEIATLTAIGLLGSCLFSYISLRSEKNAELHEKIADYLFLIAMFLLFIAVMLFSLDII